MLDLFYVRLLPIRVLFGRSDLYGHIFWFYSNKVHPLF